MLFLVVDASDIHAVFIFIGSDEQIGLSEQSGVFHLFSWSLQIIYIFRIKDKKKKTPHSQMLLGLHPEPGPKFKFWFPQSNRQYR